MHLPIANFARQLVLPATSTCPRPVVLELSAGAAGNRQALELLSILPEGVSELMGLPGTVHVHAYKASITKMLAGVAPAGEVPVFAGNEDAVLAVSPIDSLVALQHAGHFLLPILAKLEAVPWLKRHAGACEDVPVAWRVHPIGA